MRIITNYSNNLFKLFSGITLRKAAPWSLLAIGVIIGVGIYYFRPKGGWSPPEPPKDGSNRLPSHSSAVTSAVVQKFQPGFTRKIVPSSEWSKYEKNEVDPIESEDDLKGIDQIVIVNGQAYLPGTIANNLAITDDHYIRQDGQKIPLWENADQFLDLLKRIHEITSDARLKLRLEGYEPAKAMIQEFNQSNEITFGQFLWGLERWMEKPTHGLSNEIDFQQTWSFTTYVMIRCLLPANISGMVFPFYPFAPKNPAIYGRDVRRRIQFQNNCFS